MDAYPSVRAEGFYHRAHETSAIGYAKIFYPQPPIESLPADQPPSNSKVNPQSRREAWLDYGAIVA